MHSVSALQHARASRSRASRLRSTVALGAAVGLGVTLAAGPATAYGGSGPGYPDGPLECGDVVVGEVHLTRNLTCTDVGLVLTPGSTLDLDGHTLRGPGAGVPGVALQVEDEPVDPSPVSVRDGKVVGWETAMGSPSALLDVAVDQVTFRENGRVFDSFQTNATINGSRFLDNGSVITGLAGSVDVATSQLLRNETGISLGPFGPSIAVRDSTFTDNGVGISCSEGDTTVTGSTFRRNTTAVGAGWCSVTADSNAFVDNGTAVGTQMVSPTFQGLYDTYTANTFTRNDVALRLGVGARVVGNTFTANGQGLFSDTEGTGVELELMVLENNTFRRNGDGVWISTPVTVQGTTAVRNTGYGIYAPRATDLGGNVAYGNGATPQCVGVVCAGQG